MGVKIQKCEMVLGVLSVWPKSVSEVASMFHERGRIEKFASWRALSIQLTERKKARLVSSLEAVGIEVSGLILLGI